MPEINFKWDLYFQTSKNQWQSVTSVMYHLNGPFTIASKPIEIKSKQAYIKLHNEVCRSLK